MRLLDTLARPLAARLLRRAGGAYRAEIAPGARLTLAIRASEGGDNLIRLAPGAQVRGRIEIRGPGNLLEFAENCRWNGVIMLRGHRQRFRFGARSTCVGARVLVQEECDVEIGAACMLSRGIEIRTTDAHAVIDRQSGARINAPGSVRIGDHVWIGQDALIGKGARIPDDCIIGARALVLGEIAEESVALGGVPARILRRGVTWSRDWKPQFDPHRLDDWRG